MIALVALTPAVLPAGTVTNRPPESEIVFDLVGLVYLLLSVAALVFALLLLRHAVLMLKPVSFHDPRLASSGAAICVGAALFVGFLWCGAVAELTEMQGEYALFVHPRLMIPGVLIAGALPAGLATVKFFAAATAPSENSARSGAALGAIIAFINFVASIATLIGFARSL